jgi:hypothetical protein
VVSGSSDGPDGSEAALRRADERGDAGAANDLGLLLLGRDDYKQAIAAFRRADQRGYTNSLREDDQARPKGPWIPTTTHERAREVLTTMCRAIGSDPAMNAAVELLKHQSHTTLKEVATDMRHDPDVRIRPWLWLCSTADRANADGEHDIAAMAFYFTSFWSECVAPHVNPVALGFNPPPADVLRMLAHAGRTAAGALTSDAVLVTDSDGDPLTPDTVLVMAAADQDST